MAGSLAASLVLLFAVWIIGSLTDGPGSVSLNRAPFQVGAPIDVIRILTRNGLVLALHAMACVAGFIAGSSLPLKAPERTGISRVLHEHGGRFAILFVVGATTFSLSAQAVVLGISVGHVAHAAHASPALLLLALTPHALPELVALFLPLAAWIIASRRGEWDTLLAATVATVAVAVPVLLVCSVWEVYMAPHLLHLLLGYHTVHPGVGG